MNIESLNDVRPGDIMIADQSTAPSRLLVDGGEWLLHEDFRIGRFAAGHAAVVVPGNKLVEAMPQGARIRELTPDDWSEHTAFVRIPEDYSGQAMDAAAYAIAMIGTPYSIASYIYLAAWHFHFRTHWLENRINRRRQVKVFGLTNDTVDADGKVWSLRNIPVEAICSVLAEQSWTLTGKKVIKGTVSQVVTPGMLAEQLWDRLGVIKGASWLSVIN